MEVNDKMKRQKKVEALIGGLMEGYVMLMALDESESEKRKSANEGVFQGSLSSKRNLHIGGTLDELAQNMLGYTFKTEIKWEQTLTSTVQMGGFKAEEVESTYQKFAGKVNRTKEKIVAGLENSKVYNKDKADAIKGALVTLKEAKASKDLGKITEAVQGVAQVAAWGTEVNVSALLQGLKGMKKLALIANWEGYAKAGEVLGYLRGVTEIGPGIGPTTLGGTVMGKKYTGSIDFAVIAKDIHRRL